MLALVATTHATTASVMTTSLFCYSEELTIRNFLMVACSVAGRLLLRALFWSPTFVNSLVRASFVADAVNDDDGDSAALSQRKTK